MVWLWPWLWRLSLNRLASTFEPQIAPDWRSKTGTGFTRFPPADFELWPPGKNHFFGVLPRVCGITMVIPCQGRHITSISYNTNTGQNTVHCTWWFFRSMVYGLWSIVSVPPILLLLSFIIHNYNCNNRTILHLLSVSIVTIRICLIIHPSIHPYSYSCLPQTPIWLQSDNISASAFPCGQRSHQIAQHELTGYRGPYPSS